MQGRSGGLKYAGAGLVLGLVWSGHGAQAAEQQARYVPNQVLVQFKSGAGEAEQNAVRARVGAALQRTIATQAMRAHRRGDLQVLSLPPAVSVEAAVRMAEQDTAVEFAEPNWIYQHQATSNDPYYTQGLLWGMSGDASAPANAFGSQAAEAWAAGLTGSRTIVVGVIDEGIQRMHPDLAANIWSNPFDPLDGVDNDGNGYVDDVHGWDFVHDDNTVYDGRLSGSLDQHGTHVSGTIGGVGGNARGVAGVNWNVSIISGKFLGRLGGSLSDAVQAFDYFTDLKLRHGLDIVATNNSWGGGPFSRALLEAITRAAQAGILTVVAAGNGGFDGVGDNNDVVASYPGNYDTTAGAGYDAVISVAAIRSDGALASFSNFGVQTVDLGAPGEGIYSTLPWSRYGEFSGTSMATPHVTGAVALYASVCPATAPDQIRAALLASTTPTASLAGKSATGGRLDAAAMLDQGCR